MGNPVISLGLRLSLLPLCLAGCASQFLVVPDSDWQTVPAPVRARVDKDNEAELASAQAELAAASASMAALQRSQPAAAPQPAPAITASRPDPDSDPWDVAIYEHQQARGAGFTRVENARVEWQRSDRAWRERWLAAAQARVEMVTCKREMIRAQTIDRNLPGTDRYEVAPLRGQFSRAQQRWHALSTSAREARVALERASTTLASAKEAYAQLMRNGPGQLATGAAADDRSARLELSGWAVSRSDITRRRGLRHYLDTVASSPPRLRKRALKLRSPSIVIRVEPAAAPATTPTETPGHGTSAIQTAGGMKPWDTVEPAGRPPVGSPAAAARGSTATPARGPAVPPARASSTTAGGAAPAATAPPAGNQPPGVVATPAAPPAGRASGTSNDARPAVAPRSPAPSPARPVEAPLSQGESRTR